MHQHDTKLAGLAAFISTHVTPAYADDAPCFSGDTLVRVEGQEQLVKIRDVRTGQRIQCMRTTDDMRVPLSVAYCEVMNWCVHACVVANSDINTALQKPIALCGDSARSGLVRNLCIVSTCLGCRCRTMLAPCKISAFTW